MSPERIERLRRRFLRQQQEAMDRMADCPDSGAELKALIQRLNASRPGRLRFPMHLDSNEATADRRPAA